jgi:hypothetical protein
VNTDFYKSVKYNVNKSLYPPDDVLIERNILSLFLLYILVQSVPGYSVIYNILCHIIIHKCDKHNLDKRIITKKPGIKYRNHGKGNSEHSKSAKA